MERWFLLWCILWLLILLFRSRFSVILNCDDAFPRIYQAKHVQLFPLQFCHLCDIGEIRLFAHRQGTCNCVLLLLCGDISMNLGPTKYPCTVCNKPVKSNQWALLCDRCDQWSHAGCASVDNSLYTELSSQGDFSWYCPLCLCNTLPSSEVCEDIDVDCHHLLMCVKICYHHQGGVMMFFL